MKITATKPEAQIHQSINLGISALKRKALSMALEQKQTSIEDEISQFVDGLFKKNVPKATQDFINEVEKTE